ncbi:hypothetical protein [Pararhizobium mangrovi]|uniref:Uncharacterized protein n=1 Tax=Pararhizobium mangrovi TaxID=2590452 RepID=A0A506TZC7_9HYPH|nr:hypothetical protein [Pararhizobium mangrovi]TPW26850.1 hypothetical protein FJU11_13675 [Pararhizobium mangrovi]
MNAPLTEFEKRIASIARRYCRLSSGEDADGQRIALADFLCGIRDAAATQIDDAGGDPEYLQDEDAICASVRAAMQEPIDQDEIRRERSAA